MTEKPQPCVKPSRGPIGDSEIDNTEVSQGSNNQEESKMLARVGKPAPDFEANAYVDGKFKSLKLSDFKGQWVSLCFYPGDFTFV